MATELLARISSPADVKRLSLEELDLLAQEMRDAILARCQTIGGHLSSNLGVVEATIAMHYVFDAPRDKIIFDTSHQCYSHKMLTGRAWAFTNPERFDEVSGFTNPLESEYDLFRCGHTSTSISLACGLAKARSLVGGTENVVAFVGDGCLSGGEAFEGLDNVSLVGGNLIIILNDNEMSIAEDRGGMYPHFAELRATNGACENNLFRAFGIDYTYVEEGNSIPALIEAFGRVKDIDHPIVVHIHTTKGKGVAWAEADKEKSHNLHAAAPGKPKPAGDFRPVTRDLLMRKIKADPRVIAVLAATPGGIGLTPDFRAEAGDQCFDVGICEQHAVTFCAALAKGGAKPVFFVSSTFLQRAYDQIVQDLALNQTPVTVLVFQSGYTSLDATHVGVFDIAYTGNVPNITCLSPATVEQYVAMLDWSIERSGGPVVIRVPEQFVSTGEPVTFDDGDVARFKVTREGSRVALVGLGTMGILAESVADELFAQTGVNATIVSATTFSSLDRKLLFSLEKDHDLVVTFENGILYGGFGEKVARVLGTSPLRVLCFGGTKEFVDRVPANEIRQRFRLEPHSIAAEIAEKL